MNEAIHPKTRRVIARIAILVVLFALTYILAIILLTILGSVIGLIILHFDKPTWFTAVFVVIGLSYSIGWILGVPIALYSTYRLYKSISLNS